MKCQSICVPFPTPLRAKALTIQNRKIDPDWGPKITPSTPRVSLCNIMGVLTQESREVFRLTVLESYILNCARSKCVMWYITHFVIYVFVFIQPDLIGIHRNSDVLFAHTFLYIWIYTETYNMDVLTACKT